MEKNNAELFLDALGENEEIQAYVKDYDLPEEADREEALVSIAAHFGYTVTKEELNEVFTQRAESIDAAKKAAESEIRKVSLDELDSVAGGKKEHSECSDTYKNAENCWFNDGCDYAIKHYTDYLCHHNSFKL